jgi:hypothetical protein
MNLTTSAYCSDDCAMASPDVGLPKWEVTLVRDVLYRGCTNSGANGRGVVRTSRRSSLRIMDLRDVKGGSAIRRGFEFN